MVREKKEETETGKQRKRKRGRGEGVGPHAVATRLEGAWGADGLVLDC